MITAEAAIGRLLNPTERETWPGGELRSGFVIGDGRILSAWHCVQAIGGTSARAWLRLQPRSLAELYVDVPVKYEAHQADLDAAVLVVDLGRLLEIGDTHTVDELLTFLDRIALPLETCVYAHDTVRVGGFPATNPARHPTLFSGSVESADALIGGIARIRAYVPEFAARYAEWPDGMSGGPLLRYKDGIEHAVGVISRYPKLYHDQGATGGTVLCSRINELSVVFPSVDKAAKVSGPAGATVGPLARVYISSATAVPSPYRQAAIEVCQRHELVPVFSDDTDFSLTERRAKISSCQVMILLLVDTASQDNILFSELEYDWALAAPNVTILPFQVSSKAASVEANEPSLFKIAFNERVSTRHKVIRSTELNTFRLTLFQTIELYKPHPKIGASYPWSDQWAEWKQEHRRNLPSPPAMYAVPDYIGSAPFTGRSKELSLLDEWACSSDAIMVIEAIGGTGKSALAWEWMTARARMSDSSFSGTFWWSFYEGFSSMERFLRELLAYVRAESLFSINQIGREDLPGLVLQELRQHPFLVVLDGFERLLLAYHHYDPSKVTDDDVDVDRRANKHSMIDGLGYDFIRRLVTVLPTRILISTRMVPDALEGPGGALVPRVRKCRLPGLSHRDTQLLLEKLGVKGDPWEIEGFFGPLGNHPLLIAIVAGLVRDHRPAPGVLSSWLKHQPFDIRRVKLEARRRHILAAALDGLDSDEKKLLGWLSVLSGSVQWRVLESINPYSTSERSSAEAGALLDAALRNLEIRGLLWWNRFANTYDMHPIVRAFSHDQMDSSERVGANERIRDYFQALPPEETKTIASVEDLQQTITLFRALTGAEQYDSAYFVWSNQLADPLLVELGANATVTELLQPYSNSSLIPMAADLSISLHLAGKHADGLDIEKRIQTETLRIRNAAEVRASLGRLGTHYRASGQLRKYSQILDLLSHNISQSSANWPALALRKAILDVVRGAANSAMRAMADLTTRNHEDTRNPWFKSDLVYWHLFLRNQNGESLTIEEMEAAEEMHSNWRNKLRLGKLKFEVLAQQGNFLGASLIADEIDRLRRMGGLEVVPAENAFALAHSTQKTSAATAIDECITVMPRLHPFDRPYWLVAVALKTLGRYEQAAEMALKARRQAWADGPVFIYSADLRKAELLLAELGYPLEPLPKSKSKKLDLPGLSLLRQVLGGY